MMELYFKSKFIIFMLIVGFVVLLFLFFICVAVIDACRRWWRRK